MSYLQAIIIAIIEGLTEFLPISSTGHMVIASSIMGIASDEFVKLYEIVIQLSAILAVVVIYWKKFFNFKSFSFYIKLIIAVIPALVVGVLLKKHIEAILENPVFIAVVLVLGGIILLFVDDWFKKDTIKTEEEITNKHSFIVGCFQTLSIIFPGLSRSGATIIGGMQQGMTRHIAAEFSFLLAVPTMFAATVKSLYDVYKEHPAILKSSNINILLVGNVVSFLVAFAAIKFFIRFLEKNGFRLFGYYRIAIGMLILILYFAGVELFIH